ncbi:MAG: AMP-binding protein [PVC group bacterium]|nr:AMP-binding protein [PVC group bacterium]
MTKEKLYTLPEKLRQVCEESSDAVVAHIKEGSAYREITYKEFYDTAQSIAAALISKDFKKGDRAAIVLENCPEWGMVYFGIMLAGGVAVPVDSQSSFDDLDYFLRHSSAKIVFTNAKAIPVFTELAKNIDSLKNTVVVEEIRSNFISKGFDTQYDLPQVVTDDTASILYTSGTTGRPKGVMLTHGNFYANFLSIKKLGVVSDRDTVLSILPMHHAFPFTVSLIIPLFIQGKITYVSSLKSEELLQAMRDTGVTVFVAVPQLMYMFYKHIYEEMKKLPWLLGALIYILREILWQVRRISGINLSKILFSKVHHAFGKSFRFFACGGAKLNEEAGLFLSKIGFTVLEGYGLTETAPIVTLNSLKSLKIGSPGMVIPDVELKILSPDIDGIGGVAIKGPNIMKGYYNNKEETLVVLNKGWFYSGDLGYIDKRGYLHLTGREKELIILSSGKNISPEEVEAHYSETPFIKEICVLAVGGKEKTEEKLMAVVVPDMDYYRRIGEVNIYAKIKWELENFSKTYASYKRIMGFIIAKEEFSRTRLGKLKRFEIRDKYMDELLGLGKKRAEGDIVHKDADLKILASSAGKKIMKALEEELNLDRQIQLDDNLEIDLGLDSLGRVEHMSALEKFLNVSIPDEAMDSIFTVRELILTIEKLMLEKGIKAESIPSKRTEAALWSDILKSDPSEDVVGKIDLSPNRLTESGMIVICSIWNLLFRVIWRLKIRGIENLSRNESVILCPNHGSYLDGFLIAAAMPVWLKRQTFFLGYRGYFETRFLKHIIRHIKIIPIDPGARLMDAMRACAYILKKGKSACLFSEGQRSPDGEVQEFKKGIGILAKEMNVRLVPVYIDGSYESWPRTSSMPKPYPITIQFGLPQEAADLKKQGIKLGAKDDYQAIAMAIREHVITLKKKV